MQIHRLFSAFPSHEVFVPDILPSAPKARRDRTAASSRVALAALLTCLMAALLTGTAAVPIASAQAAAGASRPNWLPSRLTAAWLRFPAASGTPPTPTWAISTARK